MEVLLAIALSGALLAAMFAFLWDMLATRDRVLSAAEHRRAAAVLIERLERDLVTCIAGDDVLGAGVAGDDRSLVVLTRDVPVRLAGRGRDDGRILADLERTEYRFSPGAGTLEARRGLALPGARPDRAPYERLGDDIHLVRFRYYDGRAWRDEYDSRADGGLPVAVEVAVWFDAWPGAEIVEPDEEEDPDDPFAGDLPAGGRRTFDAEAGFDESAFAEISDFEDLGEPVPDRVRVILVPDAAEEPGVDDA
jgi:hypothetical protein